MHLFYRDHGDSHTCTHGAFGAFAAGVGTTDLEVGILKGVCAFRYPRTLKINVEGSLPSGVYGKDIILGIIGKIGVNGATDMVIEFHGPVIENLSMESRMTLCNMAVEAGATSGICQPDLTTVEYLWPFIKEEYASKQEALKDFSRWKSDPDAVYETVLNFDVSSLEPLVTFGYKPDQVKPVREMEGTPVDQVYIGSCTNGRYEDLEIAASILKGKKVNPKVRGILAPATPACIKEPWETGILKIFLDAGFCVTNPPAGHASECPTAFWLRRSMCIHHQPETSNGRMGKGGMVHLMSPATAAATAVAGYIANSSLYKNR